MVIYRLLLFLTLSGGLFAQQFSDDMPFIWIDGEPVEAWQFLNLKDKLPGESFEKKKQRFIEFKLKAIYAKSLKKDTLDYFKFHVGSYRNMLSKKMLVDTSSESRLLREAYKRSLYDIQIDHILVKSSYFDLPADTLRAYQKILTAYRELSKGEKFSLIAQKYSEDTLSHTTYFTALQLMYDFETQGYQTSKGSYSKPFRTPSGYHIVFIKDKRPAIGSYRAAHIFLRKAKGAEKKAQQIYQELKMGVSFDTLALRYSQDELTKKRGGRLPYLEVGQAFSEFEKKVLEIEIGNYSKPFGSSLGWHIVKLLSRSIPSKKTYAESKSALRDKLHELPDRVDLVDRVLYERILDKIEVVRDEKNLATLKYYFANELTEVKAIPKEVLDLKILSIRDETYRVSDFVNFWGQEIDHLLKQERKIWTAYMINYYCIKKVLRYHRDHVFEIYKQLGRDLQLFKDELLVTEVSYQEVWQPMERTSEKGIEEKASEESLEIKERKLESQWVKRLRSKFDVKVDEDVANALKLRI